MNKLLASAAALAAVTTPFAALALTDTPTGTAVEAEMPKRFTVEVVGDGSRDAILIPGLL